MKLKNRNTNPKLGRVILGILLLTILATACAAPETFPGGAEMTISAKQRQTALPFEAARVPQLVDGNTAFAFDLYQQFYQEEENLVFSPYSLSIGLAMTYGGAREETQAQMAEVLHFNLPQKQLHPAFNSLDQNLEGRDGRKLYLINALWGSNSNIYLEPFLDTLAENYSAGIQPVDFRAPDASRKQVNQWMSDQTKNRIPELLPPGSISGETELILTNAIVFQSAWANPFPVGSTQESNFTRLDGEAIPVAMMNQAAQFRYGQVEGGQAIELPYEGGEFSMLVILPEASGFEDFARSLDAVSHQSIIESLQPTMVQLAMPRFQFDFAEQLKEVLMEMGMVNAFGDADFSGMDGSLELFIDQIYHQAFVQVDEAGTEAAAGSAVVMTRKGIPDIDVTLSIDHPFIFLLRDNLSGAVIFLGHVLDPGIP